MRSASRDKARIELEEAQRRRDWSAVPHLAHTLVNVQRGNLLLQAVEHTALAECALEENNTHEARRHLRQALEINAESQEACALMGRVEMMEGHFDDALSHLNSISIPRPPPRLTVTGSRRPSATQQHLETETRAGTHAAHLVLEGLVTRVKCLEALDRHAEALEACEAFVRDVGTGHFYVSLNRQAVEEALLLLPPLSYQYGDIRSCIRSHRRSLMVPFALSQSCRCKLMHGLAHVLQRRISARTYPPVVMAVPPIDQMQGGMYIPRNQVEESILLFLLLEEENKSLVGGRNPLLTDELVVSISQAEHYPMLAGVLERSVAAWPHNEHLWAQFALVSMASGQFSRSQAIFREALRLNPLDAPLWLLASKLYMNELGEPEAAAALAQRVLTFSGELGGRAHLLLGVALGAQARLAQSHDRILSLHAQSLAALKKATDIEPYDAFCTYHLGLQCAEMNQIKHAVACIRHALSLQPGHAESWALLALLVSCCKQYARALRVCRAGLHQVPGDRALLLLQTKFEALVEGPRVALSTLRAILGTSVTDLDVPDEEVNGVEGMLMRECNFDEWLQCGAVVEAEQRSTPTTGVSEAHLWLEAATLHVDLGESCQALACVHQARLCGALAVDLHVWAGSFLYQRKQVALAQGHWELAVALDPRCRQASVKLAMLMLEENQAVRALSRLTCLVQAQPTYYLAWYYLGRALKVQGRYEEASDAFLNAIELERQSPIVRFDEILMKSV